MPTVEDAGGFRVGDLVRREGSPVVYRIDSLKVLPEWPDGWAHFVPVRQDGERDQRRTAFSGAVRGFVKLQEGKP